MSALAAGDRRRRARLRPALRLFGLAGSALLRRRSARGLKVVSEAFADRRYRADGSLQPRNEPGAVIDDEASAIAQALAMALQGDVTSVQGERIHLQADTLCLHGDGAHALKFARSLRAALTEAGLGIEAPGAR